MHSAFGKTKYLNRAFVLFAALLCFAASAQAAAQPPVFGPVTYDVKARYGRENIYRETIAAPEGLYLIKLQNGELASQRPDFLSFSVNGETLLPEKKYGYRYFACFVQLKSTNVFELAIKDATPSAFKRPSLSARNAVVTITPANGKIMGVALGVQAWEDAAYYAEALLKISSSEASAFAFAAANLKNNPEVRAEAMKKLGARRDPNAGDFIASRYFDAAESSEVRGEAVLAIGALGELAALPAIMQGMLEPDDAVRTGSVRALALYKEEDTRVPLVKMLSRMDPTMRTGVVRTFVSAGWRPVGMLLELVASPDADLANMGLALLAGSTDRVAVDALLAYLENPGPRDVRLIIAALGESKDSRAAEPLSRMASDPALGRGREAELGAALAALGDPRAVDLITAMLKRTDSRFSAYRKLLETYKQLTGADYKPAEGPGGKGR